MMSCQICGDTIGPFAFVEYEEKHKIILACEDCEKKIKKEKIKNVTANLRNKRHAH